MLLRSSLTSTIKAANIYNELLENPPENDSFCMCANDFIPCLGKTSKKETADLVKTALLGGGGQKN